MAKVTKKRSKSQDELIAYHEAGHAVMAFNKGGRFVGITICKKIMQKHFPDGAGLLFGIKWPSKKGTKKNKGLVLLAGMSAVEHLQLCRAVRNQSDEEILRKCFNEYLEDRNKDDKEAFCKLWRTEKVVRNNFHKLYPEAVQILKSPKIWRQVEVVATTLLKTKMLLYEGVQLCIESLVDKEKKEDLDFFLEVFGNGLPPKTAPRKENKKQKSKKKQKLKK